MYVYFKIRYSCDNAHSYTLFFMEANMVIDISLILGTCVTAVVAVISYFLKRTIGTVDRHDQAINHIQMTYVTKDELKDVKGELKGSLDKVSSDVEEIKENCLSKRDYYRLQNKTEEKIDKMYDLLLQMNGGNHHAD